jgi:HK97 family phage portal protein
MATAALPPTAAWGRLGANVNAFVRGLFGRPESERIPGPWAHTSDGWIPMSAPLNYWQTGQGPYGGGWNSVVFACVALYARTIAQLPGQHFRKRDDNGADVILNSAASRILRKPNGYQTRSDFLYNLVSSHLMQGNGYALALRNSRNEVDALHLLDPKQVYPLIGEDGSIFYSVGPNQILEKLADPPGDNELRWVIPERDILHIRTFCPKHPLIGVPPLYYAAGAAALFDMGTAGMANYFANMSRPSGVLRTDAVLSIAQIEKLRDVWEKQSKGIAIGGVPILTNGLKWEPYGQFNVADYQLLETLKLSINEIARVYAVPGALINDLTGATWNNVEQLITQWLRQGLAYYIDLIELNLDKLFGFERLPDFCEFNVDTLLRPDFKTRMDGLARAVQAGIYAPNEARAVENLGAADHGDEPRVQQQMVPLSFATDPPTLAPAAPPAPLGDKPLAEDENKPTDDDEEDADKADKMIDLRAAIRARALEHLTQG